MGIFLWLFLFVWKRNKPITYCRNNWKSFLNLLFVKPNIQSDFLSNNPISICKNPFNSKTQLIAPMNFHRDKSTSHPSSATFHVIDLIVRLLKTLISFSGIKCGRIFMRYEWTLKRRLLERTFIISPGTSIFRWLSSKDVERITCLEFLTVSRDRFVIYHEPSLFHFDTIDSRRSSRRDFN